MPSDEQGHADGPGARSSAYRSLFFTAGSPEDAAYLTAMRASIDDDFLGRQGRSREHHGNPRPFTESERVALRDIMAPVLRDIMASGAVLPIIQEEAYPDVEVGTFCIFLWGAGGTGIGVWIYMARLGVEQVARVAEDVQEWEIEELAAVGRSATWPECPS